MCSSINIVSHFQVLFRWIITNQNWRAAHLPSMLYRQRSLCLFMLLVVASSKIHNSFDDFSFKLLPEPTTHNFMFSRKKKMSRSFLGQTLSFSNTQRSVNNKKNQILPENLENKNHHLSTSSNFPSGCCWYLLIDPHWHTWKRMGRICHRYKISRRQQVVGGKKLKTRRDFVYHHRDSTSGAQHMTGNENVIIFPLKMRCRRMNGRERKSPERNVISITWNRLSFNMRTHLMQNNLWITLDQEGEKADFRVVAALTTKIITVFNLNLPQKCDIIRMNKIPHLLITFNCSFLLRSHYTLSSSTFR